jgi:hypothetical protein
MRLTISHWLCAVAVFATLAFSRSVAADDARELDSYMLASDEFITRDAKADDAIFFAYDPKALTAKLAEYGQKIPENINFPQGGLFILAVSDRVAESFKNVSSVATKHLLIVELEADKEAKRPKQAAKDKKTSRLLLICCSPMKDVKAWAIKDAGGAQHELKGEELKK